MADKPISADGFPLENNAMYYHLNPHSEQHLPFGMLGAVVYGEYSTPNKWLSLIKLAKILVY